MRQDGRDSQAGGTVQMEWRFRPRPCKGRKRRLDDTPQQQDVEPGNVPRISRLMALAIKFDGQIRDGAVTDYASLARLGEVNRIDQVAVRYDDDPILPGTVLDAVVAVVAIGGQHEIAPGQHKAAERALRAI